MMHGISQAKLHIHRAKWRAVRDTYNEGSSEQVAWARTGLNIAEISAYYRRRSELAR